MVGIVYHYQYAMMIFKNNLLGFTRNARSNNYSSTYESKGTSLGMYLRTILSSIYVHICNWYLSLKINSVSIVEGRYITANMQ